MGPHFHRQELFIADDHNHYRIPVLLACPDHVLLAFANNRIDTVADGAREVYLVLRRSLDGGRTWGPPVDLFAKKGWDGAMGTATLDAMRGVVLLSYTCAPRTPKAAELAGGTIAHYQPRMAVSSDMGRTWQHRRNVHKTNQMGQVGNCHGASAGIQLRHGPRKGRLVAPARFQTKPGEAVATLQQHHYNCAVFSDDHGETWQTSEPVQVGTGEGCLVELADGRIYYNSRAYFYDGYRRTAISRDGGETFTDFAKDQQLIEPDWGCNAGMASYPRALSRGKEMILFSNPAHRCRQGLIVRLSEDGGRTWKYKKTIHAGPSAYSAIAVSEEGIISVFFENGTASPYDQLSLAQFNLNWLTDAGA